jgi:uncharacterized membrane protein (UPF0127 family)
VHGERYFVLNKTRKARLASQTELARTAVNRMKGLIGRRAQSFSSGSGLWIVPCNGIHTLGMRFPIDVAYLDSKYRVLKLYHRLAPFRVAALLIRAQSVLELPPGTLELTQTEVGDELEFSPFTDST